MKEYKTQIEVCKFLYYLQDKYQFRYFHIPNGGCPDLILEFSAGRIIYIELKSKIGRLADSQKIWYENSVKLRTPHYILKGDFGDIKDELYSIVRKHGKFIETQPKSEVVK